MRDTVRLTFVCGDCGGQLVWNFSEDLWHCFGCHDGGPSVFLAKKMTVGRWPGLELADDSFRRPTHMGPPGFKFDRPLGDFPERPQAYRGRVEGSGDDGP